MPQSEEFLDNPFLPFLFVTAAGEGKTGCLSKHVATCSAATIDDAILCAAALNHPSVISFLIPHLLSRDGGNIKEILEDTVSNGHANCIRAVLSFCDKECVGKTKSLVIAVMKGNTEAVEILLPFFESQTISEALLVAIELDRRPCIEKLEESCDIESVFSLIGKRKFGFKLSGLSGLSFLDSLRMKREQPSGNFARRAGNTPL